MHHLISQLDRNNTPINIYIDLSKAFDKLDHQILLSKLEYYGVTGTANTLFSNYLCNREPLNIMAQNLILLTSPWSPSRINSWSIAFFIYINDLPSVSNILNMLMYAGDTTLYCNFNKDINEMLINREMYKVSTWLSANKLPLNVSKTKYIMVRTLNKGMHYPMLKLNDTVIERAEI